MTRARDLCMIPWSGRVELGKVLAIVASIIHHGQTRKDPPPLKYGGPGTEGGNDRTLDKEAIVIVLRLFGGQQGTRLVIGGQVSFGSPAPPGWWLVGRRFLGVENDVQYWVRNSWRTTLRVQQANLPYMPEIPYRGDLTYDGLPTCNVVVVSLGDSHPTTAQVLLLTLGRFQDASTYARGCHEAYLGMYCITP